MYTTQQISEDVEEAPTAGKEQVVKSKLKASPILPCMSLKQWSSIQCRKPAAQQHGP